MGSSRAVDTQGVTQGDSKRIGAAGMNSCEDKQQWQNAHGGGLEPVTVPEHSWAQSSSTRNPEIPRTCPTNRAKKSMESDFIMPSYRIPTRS